MLVHQSAMRHDEALRQESPFSRVEWLAFRTFPVLSGKRSAAECQPFGLCGDLGSEDT